MTALSVPLPDILKPLEEFQTHNRDVEYYSPFRFSFSIGKMNGASEGARAICGKLVCGDVGFSVEDFIEIFDFHQHIQIDGSPLEGVVLDTITGNGYPVMAQCWYSGPRHGYEDIRIKDLYVQYRDQPSSTFNRISGPRRFRIFNARIQDGKLHYDSDSVNFQKLIPQRLIDKMANRNLFANPFWTDPQDELDYQLAVS